MNLLTCCNDIEFMYGSDVSHIQIQTIQFIDIVHDFQVVTLGCMPRISSEIW